MRVTIEIADKKMRKATMKMIEQQIKGLAREEANKIFYAELKRKADTGLGNNLVTNYVKQYVNHVVRKVLEYQGWGDDSKKLVRMAGTRITALVKRDLEAEVLPIIKKTLKRFDAEAYIKEVIKEEVQNKIDRAFTKKGGLKLYGN